MSIYVDQKRAKLASIVGVKIGSTTPCSESKGTWWEVYRHNDELIACVMSSCGVSCGELITELEIPMYTDEVVV